ncbi:hypothetical protein [Streptomyces brasiliscabiei]|uniref:hypothetical protein n=1 Tax=Streptomyces brasiliscabiei TaxID=2736302 RepID=UPI001C11EB96|nr:hypothetical protein [Streptomyces brasiliscabiei]
MRSFGHCGARPLLAILADGRPTPRHRAAAGTARLSWLAVWCASLTVVACVLDTIWRLAADSLGMAGAAERAVVVGAAELVRSAAAPRCHTRYEGTR